MQVNWGKPYTYKKLSEEAETTSLKKGQSSIRDLDELVRLASDLCRWNDPDLVQVIRQIEKSCSHQKKSFESVIKKNDKNGDSILLQLVRGGDHEVLKILHRNITNGWAIAKVLERTEDSLRVYREKTDAYWGFQIFGKGCTYVGEFRNGQRNGTGKLHYFHNWYYEGEFVDNQKHGMGVDVNEGISGFRRSGIFIDDIFRGDPQGPVPKSPKIWFQPFKKRIE